MAMRYHRVHQEVQAMVLIRMAAADLYDGTPAHAASKARLARSDVILIRVVKNLWRAGCGSRLRGRRCSCCGGRRGWRRAACGRWRPGRCRSRSWLRSCWARLRCSPSCSLWPSPLKATQEAGTHLGVCTAGEQEASPASRGASPGSRAEC